MTEQDDNGAATIFDVARLAGVSASTVSRVVNRYPHIKQATRDRVEAAMLELGYVANLQARALAGGRSQLIGMLLYDLESSYHNQIVRGLDAELSASDYDVMLCTTHQRTGREASYVAQLSSGVVDGLVVILPADLSRYVEQLKARDFPFVLIDYDDDPRYNVVKVDNEHGAAQAVDHLVELGHRRIGLITGNLEHASARERRAGYQDAMRRHGLDDESFIAVSDFMEATAYDAMQQLLARDEPPTAVFTSADVPAFGAIEAIRDTGLDVPGDISVVGFDDIPEAAMTGLTTIRQPMSEMGCHAARIILDALKGEVEEPQLVVLPTELVVRDTTAAPPRRRRGRR